MDNPALVKAHETRRGLNITFYFLSFEKSYKKFISIPDIPFVVTLMLYIIKSFWDIYEHTSNFQALSKNLQISWASEGSWFMQESPGLKTALMILDRCQ